MSSIHNAHTQVVKLASKTRQSQAQVLWQQENNKFVNDALKQLPLQDRNKLLIKMSELKRKPAYTKDVKHLWKRNKDGYQTVTMEIWKGIFVNPYTANAIGVAEGWKTATFSVGDKVAFCGCFFDVWHTHRIQGLGIGFDVIARINLNGTIVLENGMQFTPKNQQVDGDNILDLYDDVINCPILQHGQRKMRFYRDIMPGKYAEMYFDSDQTSNNEQTATPDLNVIDVKYDVDTGHWG